MSQTIKLNDGKAIPAIAWGNGTNGLNSSGQKAIDQGLQALNGGIRHIDTAQLYDTEKETGETIKSSGFDRKDIWVTSKLGPDTESTTEGIRKSVEKTISELGFIPDLLLIHNPFVPEDGKRVFFYQELEKLVEDGTLKGCSLGVSNYRPQDLKEVLDVCKIKPVVNQLEFHPYVLAHLDPVLAIHKQHDIKVESYGPLSPVLRHKTGGPLKPVLKKIAERLTKEVGWEVDESTVLIQWTVQWGAVVVTTSSRKENIDKMVKSSEIKLTKEDMEEIEKVGRTIHYRAYDEHMTKDFPNPELPEDA